MTDSLGDVQIFPFPAVMDTFVPAVDFIGKGQGDIDTDRKDYHGPYWTENIKDSIKNGILVQGQLSVGLWIASGSFLSLQIYNWNGDRAVQRKYGKSYAIHTLRIRKLV